LPAGYGQTLSIFAIPRTPDTREMLLAAAGNPEMTFGSDQKLDYCG